MLCVKHLEQAVINTSSSPTLQVLLNLYFFLICCLPFRCIFNTNKQAIEFSVQPTQLYVYCGLATCFGPNSDPSGCCMTLLKTNVNAYTKMCTSFVTASPQSVSQSQSIPTDITVCCVQRSVCYDNLTIKSQIPIY